jgi:hypothetical protein
MICSCCLTGNSNCYEFGSALVAFGSSRPATASGGDTIGANRVRPHVIECAKSGVFRTGCLTTDCRGGVETFFGS